MHKTKARRGSVEQSGFIGLLCSGLHGISRVQWHSGRVFGSKPRGRGFNPQSLHCIVSLSKTYNPILVLVHSRETRPYITERLVMGRKESNQTNKYTAFYTSNRGFIYTFIIIKDTIVKILSLKRRRKSVFTFNYFQPKHMATYVTMLWVLKRPVSMRRFF